MAQTDRAALGALYNATGGPSWKHNTHWNTDADLSEWYGIKTNDQGRVVGLSLDSNNLQGPIPEELGKLTALEKLYLGRNNLSGAIPAQLGALNSVTWLDLSNNQLSGHIPPELGNLSSLRELYLFSNQLSGPIPPELGQLQALQALNLSYNQLSGRIPKELGALSKLEQLNLSNNHLPGPIPKELGALSKLEQLGLHANNLTALWDHTQVVHVVGHEEENDSSPGGPVPSQLRRMLDIFDRCGEGLSLRNNPWAEPPESIVSKGSESIRRYFEDLYAEPCRILRTSLKIILVGQEGAGKTSLRQSMTTNRAAPTVGPIDSTVLADVQHMELEGAYVRVYDCAGQVAYTGLLQMFLTPRSVCVLVCDAEAFENTGAGIGSQEEQDCRKLEELGVCDWLRSISRRAPSNDVILVATKCDRVGGDPQEIGQRIGKACRAWLSSWVSTGMLPVRVEEAVSLTSCLRVDGQGGGSGGNYTSGEAWACDWRDTTDESPPPSLLHRLVHQHDGSGLRGADMMLPRSWDIALTVLEALERGRDPVEMTMRRLTDPDGGDATTGAQPRGGVYCAISVEELSAKWQESVRELAKREITVTNTDNALEAALSIREYEGSVIRHESFVFLDVVWLTRILKVLLNHKDKETLDGCVGLGDTGDTCIILDDELDIASWGRLKSEGILEPRLAHAMWPSRLSEYVLPTLLSLGLAFPLENDPAGGLVVLLRLTRNRPARVGELMNTFCSINTPVLSASWRVFLGVPAGAIEKVLTRCCSIGGVQTFWRFGVLVHGGFGDGGDRSGDFAMVLEYSSTSNELTAQVYGDPSNPSPWCAISYVMSAVRLMLLDFPGVRCRGWLKCPQHGDRMPLADKATHTGNQLVESVGCPQCTPGSRGLGNAAAEVLRMIDVRLDRGHRSLIFDEVNARFLEAGYSFPSAVHHFEWSPADQEVKGAELDERVDWISEGRQFAKEAPSGVDRLNFDVYAAALAGLFSRGEADVLPAAVGIYAPWGSGKSFLLDHLKSRIKVPDPEPSLAAICCCCFAGLLSVMKHSIVGAVMRAIACKFWSWLCNCCNALCRSKAAVPKALVACFGCCRRAFEAKALVACFECCSRARKAVGAVGAACVNCGAISSDVEASPHEDGSGGREFVVVEFNAWECAGLEILWAVVTTKIFDAVEGHPDFGRGAVRAARIKKLLNDTSWNWCGLAMFYVTVALLGIVVVVVLNARGALDDISRVAKDLQWAVVTVILPGGVTLLNILVQMHSRGSLRTAQSALRKAISKKESVGEVYRGFMSEVKEELQTLFAMINAYNDEVNTYNDEVKTHNSKVRRERKREEASNEAKGKETEYKNQDEEGKETGEAKEIEEAKEAEEARETEEPEQNEEAKPNEKANQTEATQAEEREFRKKMALAVIVDDLDRCSKEKIMEMLKATHLLLEQPKAPMAVFLAVDPQLIVSAIAESLEGASNTMKALRYLDKIIHIPFCIPSLSAEKKRKLLYSLLHGSDNSCPKTLERVNEFLTHRAPSDDVLKACAKGIKRYPGFSLLDELEKELVYTLHWWSQQGFDSWSKQPDADEALRGLLDWLEKCPKAALETRRAACFKLLEQLNVSVNSLMGFLELEDAIVSNPTAVSSTGTPASASENATPEDERSNVRTSPQVPVAPAQAPSSGEGLPLVDESENTTSPPEHLPVGTGAEGVAGEVKEPIGGVGAPAFDTTGDGPVGPGGIPLGGVDVGREGNERPGGTPRGASGDADATSLPAALHTFNCAISKAENNTFRTLIEIVHATPRKIKRVVNVYFLQRSMVEKTEWWKADKTTREKELVTWTVLAEFWPFRLSCIAFAMTEDAPNGKPRRRHYAPDATIADVYGASASNPSTSVCKWIDTYRGKGTPKDLFLSDDTEGRFQLAISKGAQITKYTVGKWLLHNSFNLNPTMMSTIEVEMVYESAATAEPGLADVFERLLEKLQ